MIPFPGGLTTVPAAAWSPDGGTLAVGGLEGDVAVAHFPAGDEVTRIRFPGRIRLLTFSADGRYLAIGGGTSARVWDVRANAFATHEFVHPKPVTALVFHPEGRYLATGCRDDLARVFAVPADADTALWPPVPHVQQGAKGVWDLVFFSPPLFVNRGRGLITYGGTGGLSWRAVQTGKPVKTLNSPETSGRIFATELSPNGRYLALRGIQNAPIVRLFDFATGRPVEPVATHKNTAYHAAFSPDSRMLLTSSSDDTARLWAVPGGAPLAPPLDLHRTVQFVTFAPDGQSVATQDGQLVRIWALPGDGVPITRVPVGSRSFAAVSPDGALAFPTGMSMWLDRIRMTRVYHVATGQPTGPPLHSSVLIIDAVFSPDGRSVATAGARDDQSSDGPELRLWDWVSGQELWRTALPSAPRSLAYRPDGRRIAVLCGGGELLVFDPDEGRETVRWRAHDAEAAQHWINNGKVTFSPDGQLVLTWGMGNDLRVWEATTGRPRYAPISHRDKCHDVQFSPDGRSMALASYDGSVPACETSRRGRRSSSCPPIRMSCTRLDSAPMAGCWRPPVAIARSGFGTGEPGGWSARRSSTKWTQSPRYSRRTAAGCSRRVRIALSAFGTGDPANLLRHDYRFPNP